jgi:hypothetical protein
MKINRYAYSVFVVIWQCVRVYVRNYGACGKGLIYCH